MTLFVPAASSGRRLTPIAGRRWELRLLIALAMQKADETPGQPRASYGLVSAEIIGAATGYE
jgi:hypothetical protein